MNTSLAARIGLLLSAVVVLTGAPGAQPRSPSVTIVSPRESEYVAGRTALRARVEPASEATSVIFYVDGVQVCSMSAPPFECGWNAGVDVVEHQIRAAATFTGARHVVSNVRTKSLGYAEAVDVRSVQLTATVTDNRGRFVRGLPRRLQGGGGLGGGSSDAATVLLAVFHDQRTTQHERRRQLEQQENQSTCGESGCVRNTASALSTILLTRSTTAIRCSQSGSLGSAVVSSFRSSASRKRTAAE